MSFVASLLRTVITVAKSRRALQYPALFLEHEAIVPDVGYIRRSFSTRGGVGTPERKGATDRRTSALPLVSFTRFAFTRECSRPDFAVVVRTV